METDTLGFQVTCLEKAASRRGVLSLVSSVYDPLGRVAPFILSGKIIVQKLCRLRLDEVAMVVVQFATSGFLLNIKVLPAAEFRSFDLCSASSCCRCQQ